MRKYYYLPLLLLFCITKLQANDIVFGISAPNVVEKGQELEVEYFLIDSYGTNITIPFDIEGFDVIMGPTMSQIKNQTVVDGQVKNELIHSYKYTLIAKKQGTFTLPAAKIIVNGVCYKSGSKKIKVTSAGGEEQPGQTSQQPATKKKTNAAAPKVTNSDVFIRVMPNKTKVFTDQSLVVTYRLYTKLNIKQNQWDIVPPEYEGFEVSEITLPRNRRFAKGSYNGKIYNTIELKKVRLKPLKPGSLTISPLSADIQFIIKTGEKVKSLFSEEDRLKAVKETVKTDTTAIKVSERRSNRIYN